MIWATYATLGQRMWTWRKRPQSFTFEEKAWCNLVDLAKQKGLPFLYRLFQVSRNRTAWRLPGTEACCRKSGCGANLQKNSADGQNEKPCKHLCV